MFSIQNIWPLNIRLYIPCHFIYHYIQNDTNIYINIIRKEYECIYMENIINYDSIMKYEMFVPEYKSSCIFLLTKNKFKDYKSNKKIKFVNDCKIYNYNIYIWFNRSILDKKLFYNLLIDTLVNSHNTSNTGDNLTDEFISSKIKCLCNKIINQDNTISKLHCEIENLHMKYEDLVLKSNTKILEQEELISQLLISLDKKNKKWFWF